MCSNLLELPPSKLDENLADPPFYFLNRAPLRTRGPLAPRPTLHYLVSDYNQSPLLRVWVPEFHIVDRVKQKNPDRSMRGVLLEVLRNKS